MIVRVKVVLERTVVGDNNTSFHNYLQFALRSKLIVSPMVGVEMIVLWKPGISSRYVQDLTLMRLKFLTISIRMCPHW